MEEDRGHLALAVGEDPAALDDPKKAAALLEERFQLRTATDWFAALDQVGVPAEVVNEEFCRTMFDDPEVRALGLIVETWAGAVGRFEDPGLLVNFSSTPGVVQRGPCMCGEHTRELLREHGYDDDEIDALSAEKAILDAPVSHP